MTSISNKPLPPSEAAESRAESQVEDRIDAAFERFQDPRKIFHHVDRLYELRTTGDTRPVHLGLGLTNYCNHKCPWCYINWHQSGRASERSGAGDRTRRAINAEDRILEAVGEAVEMGLKAVTIAGDGEPTLHPRFPEILDRLKAMGLDIGIFSNFGTANDACLDAMARNCFFVRGSIDAASKEVHAYTHGAEDFDAVIANLRRLVDLRGENKRPIIGVQYVMNHKNIWEVPRAAEFYKSLGVDYLTLKPAYKNELNPAHPENEVDVAEAIRLMTAAKSQETSSFKVYAKFPQLKEVVGHKTNGGRYYKKCQATPLSPYLDEDGNVEMCGNLKGRGTTMGNVFESSFQEIWASARRKECLASIDLNTCPSGCKLDPLNKVLWDAFYPDVDSVHPNFV
ncbi:MAG: radical SAM/SPASM domain-containing protein [Magnetovibrionaceae bacterium]